MPVQGYSNAEGMLATSGVTPLLGNLECMTTKARAGWGTKNNVPWKTEKAEYYVYYVHTGKFKMGFSPG